MVKFNTDCGSWYQGIEVSDTKNKRIINNFHKILS